MSLSIRDGTTISIDMLLLKPILAFLFAAMIIATSGAMASARGMAVNASGEMILCTGTGVITLQVDADGQPIGPVHYCPDCALAALAAVVPKAIVSPPAATASLVKFFAPTRQLTPHVTLGPTARDPPSI